MKRDLWIKKARSFKEAERLDDEYYIRESPEERLSDIQFCREQYFIIKGIDIDESRKRLRRVFRVIKQK
ncbi:MAG: hypothetical protein A3I04_06250 [Nitrospinae bacterium RIFCSPLOWO2_02_FULL_39_110]|nr:MAG: hypothetical protein A3D97_05595 [Nitrospinae bacterium RIFCSPHIGHO2_12_FULL_39_42]OGW04742.1 MAG: hypothetical protein A3I04_06250 [Nitrospinae bacterium RIFCSPLOWO2_02_FULL_39_110]